MVSYNTSGNCGSIEYDPNAEYNSTTDGIKWAKKTYNRKTRKTIAHEFMIAVLLKVELLLRSNYKINVPEVSYIWNEDGSPSDRSFLIEYIDSKPEHKFTSIKQFYESSLYKDGLTYIGIRDFALHMLDRHGVYLWDTEVIVTSTGDVYLVDFDKVGIVRPDKTIYIPGLKSQYPLTVDIIRSNLEDIKELFNN